jgi:hypothetical protein
MEQLVPKDLQAHKAFRVRLVLKVMSVAMLVRIII